MRKPVVSPSVPPVVTSCLPLVQVQDQEQVNCMLQSHELLHSTCLSVLFRLPGSAAGRAPPCVLGPLVQFCFAGCHTETRVSGPSLQNRSALCCVVGNGLSDSTYHRRQKNCAALWYVLFDALSVYHLTQADGAQDGRLVKEQPQ